MPGYCGEHRRSIPLAGIGQCGPDCDAAIRCIVRWELVVSWNLLFLQGGPMKRREFLKSLGYAAAVSLASESITVATPTAAWSQTAEKHDAWVSFSQGYRRARGPDLGCCKRWLMAYASTAGRRGATWSSKFAMPGGIQRASPSWR